MGVSLPNNRHLHRTLRIQEDVLPYALCCLLCPVSAALASMACLATSPGTPLFAKDDYRGTSLIRNTPLLRPYSTTVPRVLWWSWGGGCFL